MVLPMLFSALAPGLLAGTGIGTLGASAIGAGLGGLIQSGGDLEEGLLTGLGAFAGGSLMGGLMGGTAAGGAAGTGATGTGAVAPGANLSAAANPAASGVASLPMQAKLATIGNPAAPMNVAAKPPMMQGAMDFMKSPTGMGVGIGAMAGPMLKGMFDKGDDGKRKSNLASKEMRPLPSGMVSPGSDYQPGVSPEFNYGVGRVPTAGQIIDFRDTGALRYSDGGLLRRYQQMMGPVKMAEGGIASLAEMDEGMPAQAAPMGGNEKDVIVEAVRAIKGQSENPQMALAAFLSAYGEQALRDLVDRVQSGEFDGNAQSSTGKLVGAGDGMQDMIPASIDGEQDVLLSDGEYVVPADVVSGLGNGSSEAGARTLDDMASKVRQSRTGSPEQPPRVPQEAMLPV